MTLSPNPDIVARAQQGEAQAIGALYDQHHEALFRYVWARVGERQTAEDLTSDTFLRMLAALPRYRPAQAPFRAWLYRIAHNVVIDHYRQAAHRKTVPLADVEQHAAPHADPAAHIDETLTLERLHRALPQLDGAQGEVVALRFLSGLSLQETAAVLGKTEMAVKALQHRGLLALRQALTET